MNNQFSKLTGRNRTNLKQIMNKPEQFIEQILNKISEQSYEHTQKKQNNLEHFLNKQTWITQSFRTTVTSQASMSSIMLNIPDIDIRH